MVTLSSDLCLAPQVQKQYQTRSQHRPPHSRHRHQEHTLGPSSTSHPCTYSWTTNSCTNPPHSHEDAGQLPGFSGDGNIWGVNLGSTPLPHPAYPEPMTCPLSCLLPESCDSWLLHTEPPKQGPCQPPSLPITHWHLTHQPLCPQASEERPKSSGTRFLLSGRGESQDLSDVRGLGTSGAQGGLTPGQRAQLTAQVHVGLAPSCHS